MKILHLIDSGGLYGAEKMLIDLAWEQLHCGHEPMIVSIGTESDGEKAIEKEAFSQGVPCRPYRMKAGLNFSGALRILRDAKQQGFEILHSHGYKGNILFGLLPKKMRRLPLVSTLHGWTSTGGISKMALYERLDALSLSRADAVAMVNDSTIEHPRLKSIPREKKSVIYNGIRLHESKPLSVDDPIATFCHQTDTLIAVGRFSPEKNHLLLIEVLAELVQEGHDLQLLILGEGRLLSSYEQKALQLGISERLMMPGYVNTVDAILPLCRAFVMPSQTEGLPIALLEAMAANVPVIASGVGAVPVVLGKGSGILIEPGNKEALRTALEWLLDVGHDPGQMVKLARQRVENEYASTIMAEKYIELYRQLLPELAA